MATYFDGQMLTTASRVASAEVADIENRGRKDGNPLIDVADKFCLVAALVITKNRLLLKTVTSFHISFGRCAKTLHHAMSML